MSALHRLLAHTIHQTEQLGRVVHVTRADIESAVGPSSDPLELFERSARSNGLRTRRDPRTGGVIVDRGLVRHNR
jgi:hypothetical protein